MQGHSLYVGSHRRGLYAVRSHHDSVRRRRGARADACVVEHFRELRVGRLSGCRVGRGVQGVAQGVDPLHQLHVLRRNARREGLRHCF